MPGGLAVTPKGMCKSSRSSQLPRCGSGRDVPRGRLALLTQRAGAGSQQQRPAVPGAERKELCRLSPTAENAQGSVQRPGPRAGGGLLAGEPPAAQGVHRHRNARVSSGLLSLWCCLCTLGKCFPPSCPSLSVCWEAPHLAMGVQPADVF